MNTNKLKYTLFAFLLLLLPQGIMAQRNLQAMQQALTQVLGTYGENADTVAATLSKRFKKVPEAQVNIGRAYYRNDQIGKAEVYIVKALAINPNCSKAYVLRGDIAASQNDTTKALSEYQTAMRCDSSDVEAFLHYVDLTANTRPEMAVQALEALKKSNPSYPAELSQGYIWYASHAYAKAVEAYDQADSTKFDKDNYERYAASLYFTQQFDRSLKVINWAERNNNSSTKLDRFKFYNLAELQRDKEAYEEGVALFNTFAKGSEVKETVSDNEYYTMVCARLRKYDDAMVRAAEFANRDSIFSQADRSSMAERVDRIVNTIKASGDYKQAAEVYGTYLDNLRQPTDYDAYRLTQIYAERIDTLLAKGGDAHSAYQDLDSIYTRFEKEHAKWDQLHIVLYYHAYYCQMVNDPQVHLGTAIPLYEKVMRYIATMPNAGDRERRILKNTYIYLAFCYANQSKNAEARKYCEKILDIDPTDTNARNLLKSL